MLHRTSLVVGLTLLVLVGLPLAGSMQPASDSSAGVSNPSNVATMAGMRSLVPSLLALGWDDFFVSARSEIELSPRQIGELLSLRSEFLLAQQALQHRLRTAKLDLYEVLDGDQVSMEEVEAQARKVCGLNTELVALRFRSLLRAINVLTHEQHQRLASYLALQDGRRSPPLIPQSFRPEVPQHPLHFTPVQQWEAGVAMPKREETCGKQPSISVEALLSYDQGQKAPKRLAKLASRLQRRARGKNGLEIKEARRLVAQMKPEVQLIEHMTRTLLDLGEDATGHSQEEKNTPQLLDPSAIADLLAHLEAQLSDRVPDSVAIAQQAGELKSLANAWRKNFRQAADLLCLNAASPESVQSAPSFPRIPELDQQRLPGDQQDWSSTNERRNP